MKKIFLSLMLSQLLCAQDVTNYMIASTHLTAANTGSSVITTTNWLAFGWFNPSSDTIVNIRAYLGGTAASVGVGEITNTIVLPGSDSKPSTTQVGSPCGTTSPSPISGVSSTPINWTCSTAVSAGFLYSVIKNTGAGSVSFKLGSGITALPVLSSGQQVSDTWVSGTTTNSGSPWVMTGNTPYVVITYQSGRVQGVPITNFASDATNAAYGGREPANHIAPQPVALNIAKICMSMVRSGIPTTAVKLWAAYSDTLTGTLTKQYAFGNMWTGATMDTSTRPYCDFFTTPFTIPAGKHGWFGMSDPNDSVSLKYAPGVTTYDSGYASTFAPLGGAFYYCPATNGCVSGSDYTQVGTGIIPFSLGLVNGNPVTATGNNSTTIGVIN